MYLFSLVTVVCVTNSIFHMVTLTVKRTHEPCIKTPIDFNGVTHAYLYVIPRTGQLIHSCIAVCYSQNWSVDSFMHICMLFPELVSRFTHAYLYVIPRTGQLIHSCIPVCYSQDWSVDSLIQICVLFPGLVSSFTHAYLYVIPRTDQ